MTPRVPGGRLATLSTIGPTAMRGTVAAMAVRVVQHSSTRDSPWTDPARWSYSHTPSKPSPSAAMAPSRTSDHCRAPERVEQSDRSAPPDPAAPAAVAPPAAAYSVGLTTVGVGRLGARHGRGGGTGCRAATLSGHAYAAGAGRSGMDAVTVPGDAVVRSLDEADRPLHPRGARRALALAADPAEALDPAAVPLSFYLTQLPGPLPGWYMPPATARGGKRWRAPVVLAIVAAFLVDRRLRSLQYVRSARAGLS